MTKMKTSFKYLIAALLVLLGGSVWSAAEIVFYQDFDSGSLNIAETQVAEAHTDNPVITLAPRALSATGRWFHFDITGMEGKRPLFRAPLKGDGRRAHHLNHRYVYSLDRGKTFRFFNNATHQDDGTTS